MGLSIAIAGGIVCATLIGVVSILFSVTDQVYEVNSARSQNFDLENILIHTNVATSNLVATQNNNKVSLSLENTGLEKLWNYDNFNFIVTYTADIGGSPKLVSEQVTYNSAQSFGNQGCSTVPSSSSRWVIDSITNDLMDPRILNSHEIGSICIRLSNNIYSSSTVTVNLSTDSGKTTSDTTTSGPPTVPGVPTNLSATTVSSTQINLSWTAPSNGGSAITGYKIERESPVGGGWSTLVADTGSTSTSYSDTGLTRATQYNYRVSAINAIGTGSASSAANATTNSIVPGIPTGLTANAVSSSRIDLSWTAPADNGGSAITGYKIERESPVGGGWSTLVADTGSTSTSYSDTSLYANTQYNYRVSAINAIGTGSASSAANAITLVGSSTRLYFATSSTPSVSPSFDSWSETDSSVRRQLLTAKSASESLNAGTSLSWTAGNTQLDRQYVSPPMEAGISFSSATIKLQLACLEGSSLSNSVPRMSAKIVSLDGTTLRQTLLTIANYGTTSEYNIITLRNVQFANGDTLTGSYITASGDRLVIEIGHSDSSGTLPSAQCRYGAPTGTSDHGENDTETTVLVPWAEFSNTIRFQ